MILAHIPYMYQYCLEENVTTASKLKDILDNDTDTPHPHKHFAQKLFLQLMIPPSST